MPITPEARLVKLVQGALKNAIYAHGAINMANITSATKRICGELSASACVQSALGVDNNTKPLTEATHEVEVPRKSWATSQNVRPVIAKKRKPRLTSELVS